MRLVRAGSAALSIVVAIVSAGVLGVVSGPARADTGGDILAVVGADTVPPEVRGLARIDATTGAITVLSTNGPSTAPGDVAVGPNGELYLVDFDCCGGNGSLFRVDPVTGTQTTLSGPVGFSNPIALTVTPNGRIYVVDTLSVIEVDPVTGDKTERVAGGLPVGGRGITLGWDGQLYVAAGNGIFGAVVRVDPNTGTVTPISNDALIRTPGQIALTPDGQIYITERACCGGIGAVLRIDPATGTASVVTQGGELSSFVAGIDIGANGELIVGNDFPAANGARVVGVNPTTGAQRVISASTQFDRVLAVQVIPGLSVGDVSVAEGTGGAVQAVFPVTLDPPSIFPLTVPYATSDGSAIANGDYGASSAIVQIPAGQAATTISVPITPDRLAEPTETFSLTISAPQTAGITRGTGVATIADDDGTATLSIADATVSEGDSGTTVATFHVTISPASGQSVTVEYATSNVTAHESLDYQRSAGTLTFQPGETSQTISVPILGDTVHEDDERFTVGLTSPTGGAVIGRAQAIGLIRDDDEDDDGGDDGNDDDDDPPLACTPRPRVQTRPVAASGALQVTIEATPLNTGRNNALSALRFGRLDNAVVSANGQQITSGQTVSVPPHTFATSFTITRQDTSQPVTVHLTVVDGCGEWPTFVGAGTGVGL